MHSMEIDRRTFCQAAGAALLLPSLPQLACADTQAGLYASAYRNAEGAYGAALLRASGDIARTVPLPARGHGFAAHLATRRIVAFARRPGRHAVAIDRDGKSRPLVFEPPAERHFYGHGVFSRDGRVLFTTENEFETGKGIVGLYDATHGFAPIGAIASGGIGPHDLDLMPDARTLVVANGGIRTHPDIGREPMNIEQMKPCLAYIAIDSGDIVDRVALPESLHKLSLRHLAVNDDGLVIVGCQYKGPRNETPALLFTHRMGEEAREFTLPGAVTRKLRNYVSSVALDTSGRYAAITSSKGGAALILDTEARRLAEMRFAGDISGIAAGGTPHAFVATSGDGRVGPPEAMGDASISGLAWDNHLVRVG